VFHQIPHKLIQTDVIKFVRARSEGNKKGLASLLEQSGQSKCLRIVILLPAGAIRNKRRPTVGILYTYTHVSSALASIFHGKRQPHNCFFGTMALSRLRRPFLNPFHGDCSARRDFSLSAAALITGIELPHGRWSLSFDKNGLHDVIDWFDCAPQCHFSQRRHRPP
jgi:hypothetical protein